MKTETRAAYRELMRAVGLRMGASAFDRGRDSVSVEAGGGPDDGLSEPGAFYAEEPGASLFCTGAGVAL